MDTIIIILLAVSTIIILRNILKQFPRFYFAVQDIIVLKSEDISFIGFMLRFGLIFIFGFIVSYIYKGSYLKVIEYSLVVSFLLIWPFILDNIIYKDKIEDEMYDRKNKVLEKEKNKYLIVYLMFTIMSVIFSLAAIPVYNIIKGNPENFYIYILKKFTNLDLLMQSIISNIISWIVLVFLGFIFKMIYKKYVKRKFI
jgi:hypothetical protein